MNGLIQMACKLILASAYKTDCSQWGKPNFFNHTPEDSLSKECDKGWITRIDSKKQTLPDGSGSKAFSATRLGPNSLILRNIKQLLKYRTKPEPER